MSERISVSEFARRAECNEKQVRRAIEKKLLIRGEDGLLEASDIGNGWRKKNSRSILKSSDNSSDNLEVVRTVRTVPEVPVKPTIRDDETPADAADRLVESVELLPHAEALEKKENYLALLKQLEYEQKAGTLVELDTAQQILFEEFRAQRDAWLNWPTRVGPEIAADLGLEADKVTEILTTYVHQHISRLGKPDPNFAERES